MAGPSRRDILSDSPAERSAHQSHTRAAVEAHRRAQAAYRSAVYRLAAPRLVAYRPVALAALAEHTPGAGVLAELEKSAAYTPPSPGADRLRAIAPAAAQSAAYTRAAHRLEGGLRAACLKVACRLLSQRNPRAAGSTRAWWDPHPRRAADSTPGALARQRALLGERSASRQQTPALPEEWSGQPAHPGPPQRSAVARSEDM
jgi:hypothetical protein